MGFVVGLFHALHGDMGVNLRRRQVNVAEQCLDASQIGPIIQKMGGKAMAKLVWADAQLDRGLSQMLFHHQPDGSR